MRKLLPTALAAVTLLAGTGPAMAASADPEPPEAAVCPLVIRLLYDTPAELASLGSWLEPWEVRRNEGVAVFGVSPAELERLEAAGYRVEVDTLRTRELCAAMSLRPKAATAGIPGYECYRTIDETYAAAAALAAAHPLLVEWRDIGDSWEKLIGSGGRDLMLLRITNRTAVGVGAPDGSPDKPILYVEASLHAREYTPAETVTRFAERLVAGYGNDPDITWILDQHEIQLLLMANPDGRLRAQNGTLWRKNADNDFCGGSSQRGVDLNRNFERDWGCCNGSSASQCSEIFRGPGPASEPETRAIEDHLRRTFDNHWAPTPADDTPGLFLDMHSAGGLVLWPWGASHDVAPNGAALARLGVRLADFSGSMPIQGIDWYPAAGTAMDFAYADRGIAAYTIEIGYEFFERCSLFEGALVGNMLDTLVYAARVAGAPYSWPAGPEIDGLALAVPGPRRPGDVAVVGGRANRREVTEVQVSVDLPPWAVAPADRIVAVAVDGSFDGSDEPFEAAIPTAGLAGGRHLVYARARGADGSWGAPWAVFLEIVDISPRRPTARLGN